MGRQDQVPGREIKKMVNSHEKLIETIMKGKISKIYLLQTLELEGYKGTEDDVIVDMLGAIADTTAYIGQEELTEEEYFKMLVKEMNINY